MASDPARVLTQATLKAAEILGLNNIELARTIGISATQVDTLRLSLYPLQPSSDAGQLSLLLIRAQLALVTLIGEDQALRSQWLRTHNAAIGEIPLVAMSSEAGLIRVVDQLEGYLQGGYHRPPAQ
jgi:hypothetical protein